MAKLIYAAITSLDGYVNDSSGRFDWCMPDAAVHAFVNDLERDVGTYLYGRRMYDVMQVWETIDADPGEDPEMSDYAEIWRAADKVVYSTTLAGPSTSRTRIERGFDADAVRAMKADATSDISIGGPTIAAAALRAGVVDELHQFLSPVVVGGGTPSLPDDVFLQLELLDEHRFANGVVHLHHRVVPPG